MPVPGLVSVLAGVTGGRVSLDAVTDIIDVQGGTLSSAALRLTNRGDIVSITVSGGTVVLGQWIDPAAAADATYSARVTILLSIGPIGPSPTGVWVDLGTTREWGASISGGGGTVGANVTVEIRRNAGPALATKTPVTISATSL